MGIPLTGTGGLFDRLGHLFGLINIVNTHRGTTVPTHINTIQADYQTTDQNVIDGIYSTLTSYQNNLSFLPSALQSNANSTVNQMAAEADNLTSQNSISISMTALIADMIAASATVQSCNASATVTAGASNNGNPNILVSLYRQDYKLQENAFAETVAGTVTSDNQTSGVTIGSETITFKGQYSISDPLSWLYPNGSGSNAGITCINGSLYQNRGTQNYLNNGNFENFTVANTPDNWNIIVGTPGTTIFKSTSTFFDGLASLQFTGNSTENTAIYQAFSLSGVTGDTSAIMLANDQVAINAWVKLDVSPAAGVLRFSLVDSANSIINGPTGIPNLFTVNLSSIGTSWTAVSGWFYTPRVLPSAVRLRIDLSTALSTGSNVFIDRVALAEPYYFYQGGPAIAAFSGNIPLINGDTFTIQVFNNYAGQFQRFFDRVFNMKSLNLLLPSSGTPSIPDSLIS